MPDPRTRVGRATPEKNKNDSIESNPMFILLTYANQRRKRKKRGKARGSYDHIALGPSSSVEGEGVLVPSCW
jgi:hypothetical protein